jgi:hypothetical protein
MTKMLFPEDDNVVKAVRLGGYDESFRPPFCQGDRAQIDRSRMLWLWAAERKRRYSAIAITNDIPWRFTPLQ